ncbi:MAG: type II secretion system F family protein [Lentisphaeria bacterium]|nr:type II secretion system F family protein [Lentisphaeria bacterium]
MMQLLASVFAGLAVGCLAKFVMEKIAESQSRAAARNKELDKSLSPLFQLAKPLRLFFLPLAGSDTFAPLRNVTQQKLIMAGYGDTLSAEDYWAIRLALAAIGGLLLFMGSIAGQMFSAVLMACYIVFYPDLWLRTRISKRHRSITNALPNVLDLLTLSVEAGRDIISGLRDIVSRRKPDPLGEELMRTLQEIQLGKKRTAALKDMSNRVRLPELTSTVNAIIQAEELGVSIAHLLRIQGDMQRNKRFSLAEKRANEAAVKIILPVAAFILPAVFIILLGPLLVQTMRSFGGQ